MSKRALVNNFAIMAAACLRWFKPLARSVATIISHLGSLISPYPDSTCECRPFRKAAILCTLERSDQVKLGTWHFCSGVLAVYEVTTARRARLLILMNWDDDEPTWKWYAPEAVTRTLSHFAVTGKVVRNRPSDEPVLNTFVFIYGGFKGLRRANI